MTEQAKHTPIEPWHRAQDVFDNHYSGPSDPQSFNRALDEVWRAGAAAYDDLRTVLKKHHDWHLSFGDVSTPDGEGGYVTWDLSGAYADSALCDETIAALKHSPETAAERDRLRAENAELLGALREIAEGKGAYSQDPFEHARNCIEDMKSIASAVLAKYEADK